MKTVTMQDANGVTWDISKAAAKWVKARKRECRDMANLIAYKRDFPDDSLGKESWLVTWEISGTERYIIERTVGDLLGPRKRQAFVKAVESAYERELPPPWPSRTP